MEKRKRT